MFLSKKRVRNILIFILLFFACILILTGCGKINLKYTVEFYVDGTVYATVGTNGEKIDIPLDPEKEGMTFVGWFLDEGTWEEPFTAQTLLEQPLQEEVSLKVYARWKKYEFGDEFSLKDFKKTEDGFSISLSNNIEEIDFKEFVDADGYAWEVSTTKGNWGTNTSFSLVEGDNVFYIKLSKERNSRIYSVSVRRKPMYAVAFDTGDGESMPVQYVEEGGYVNVDGIKPERAGYSFVGWDHDPSEPINANVTFTAKWQGKEYVLTFDAAGGNLSEKQIRVTYGDKFQLPIPERSKYEFVGWMDGDKLWNGDPYGEPGDKVLTAKWKIAEYRITYLLNGGTNNSKNAISYTAFDEDIVLLSPTKTGADFLGWRLGDAYGRKMDKIPSGTEGDLILYAEWQLIEYPIIYHWDGGEKYEDLSSIGYSQSYTIESMFVFNPAYKMDYMFDGWYENADFSGEPLQEILPGRTGEIELWAKWEFGTEGLFFESDGNNGWKVTSFPSVERVIVPGTYHSMPVRSIATSNISENVKELIICEGVEKIGLSAANGCTGLVSLSLPSTITEIEDNAFYGCNALEQIYFNAAQCADFPEDNDIFAPLPDYIIGPDETADSLRVTVGKDVLRLPANFLNDTLVKEVIFEEGGCLMEIGNNAFEGLHVVGRIVLPQTLKTIGNRAFSRADFSEIVLPEGLEVIGEMAFMGCYNLRELIIPESVGYIGADVFLANQAILIRLEAAEVSKYWSTSWNSGNRPVIIDCKNNDKATDGYIYVYYDDLLYRIGEDGAEFLCQPSSAQTVVIADVIEYKGESVNVISVAENAFRNSNVLEVTLPAFMTEVRDSMFMGCDNLRRVTLGEKTTSIGIRAFDSCVALEEIFGTENIIEVGSNAFSNCESITYLNLPKLEVVPADMCYDCGSLTSVTLSPTLREIGSSAFSYCALTEFVFPETLEVIGSFAFSNSKLQIAVLPDSLTEMQYSAFRNSALKEVRLPAGMTVIPSDAFWGTHLETVYLPTELTEIERGAFGSCVNLKKVILNNKLTTIGVSAFELCVNLQEIILPDSVTKVEERAFMDCYELSYLELSQSLQFIGKEAFYGCRSLPSVLLRSTIQHIGENAFSKCETIVIYIDDVKPLDWSLGATGRPTFEDCAFSETGDYIVYINTYYTLVDYVYPSTVVVPVRKGYIFGGWYLNPELESTKITDLTSVSGGANVYAKWIEVA